MAAKRVLGIASRKDIAGLQRVAASGGSVNERLFAGYLLYRMDPVRFRELFCGTFPATELDIQAFVGLPTNLPDNSVREMPSVSRSDVKWPIDFWAIENAMLECVKSGDTTAVHRFMLLEGKGDGEIGEGLASDIMNLFIRNPELVINHWDDFKNHLGFLDELDGWHESPEVQKARDTYKALLSPSDPRLPLILQHFNQTH